MNPTLPRRTFLASAAALALTTACAWPPAVQASAASTVDLAVIDRDSGRPLDSYWHQGRRFVAGRPGARYALRVSNRSAERVLVVMAVDGINIVSGQTADWNQGGYVLAPWQSYDIAGWRKSDREVAAFEFTALPDSYAARTGRPLDVGVIGVAVFQERVVPVALAAPAVRERAETESRANAGDAQGLGGSMARKSAADSLGPVPAAPAAAPERLGTGHGARESSYVSSTQFVRRSAQPSELLSIQYDRWENLVSAGVIPQLGLASPRPFPRSNAERGFVPDPPMR